MWSRVVSLMIFEIYFCLCTVILPSLYFLTLDDSCPRRKYTWDKILFTVTSHCGFLWLIGVALEHLSKLNVMPKDLLLSKAFSQRCKDQCAVRHIHLSKTWLRMIISQWTSINYQKFMYSTFARSQTFPIWLEEHYSLLVKFSFFCLDC